MAIAGHPTLAEVRGGAQGGEGHHENRRSGGETDPSTDVQIGRRPAGENPADPTHGVKKNLGHFETPF